MGYLELFKLQMNVYFFHLILILEKGTDIWQNHINGHFTLFYLPLAFEVMSKYRALKINLLSFN